MKISDILVEKLTRVSTDVDMLYETYFADILKSVQNGTFDIASISTQFYTDTSILKTAAAKKAHSMNPCRIVVHARDGNYYEPLASNIGIAVNSGAYRLLADYGSMEEAARVLDPELAARFTREFTPAVVKGSIHHELSHWIDDTFHNQHIAKRVRRAKEQSTSVQAQLQEPINAHHLERASQIHNIVQLKRQHAKEWDSLSFDDMIKLSAPLSFLVSKFDELTYEKWRRQILTRMGREGLLGRNMTRR